MMLPLELFINRKEQETVFVLVHGGFCLGHFKFYKLF